MKNYKLLWTDSSGQPRVSVVSYDERSAHARQKRLVVDHKDARVVEIRPGEVLQPQR